MVRWAEDDQVAKQVLADLSAELDAERSVRDAEPHVSELLYCLTRSFYQRRRPLPPTPNESLIFLLGMRLEDVLLRPHKQHKSGLTEGILWEADWLDYADLGEFKTTRLSAKKGGGELPDTWVKQILSYMYVTGKTEAVLAVLHLLGNYSPPFPMLRAWRMYATAEEVKDNWLVMQYRREVFEQHLKKNVPPKQFEWNEPWECDNCRYLLICQGNQAVEDLSPQLEQSIRLVKSDGD